MLRSRAGSGRNTSAATVAHKPPLILNVQSFESNPAQLFAPLEDGEYWLFRAVAADDLGKLNAILTFARQHKKQVKTEFVAVLQAQVRGKNVLQVAQDSKQKNAYSIATALRTAAADFGIKDYKAIDNPQHVVVEARQASPARDGASSSGASSSGTIVVTLPVLESAPVSTESARPEPARTENKLMPEPVAPVKPSVITLATETPIEALLTILYFSGFKGDFHADQYKAKALLTFKECSAFRAGGQGKDKSYCALTLAVAQNNTAVVTAILAVIFRELEDSKKLEQAPALKEQFSKILLGKRNNGILAFAQQAIIAVPGKDRIPLDNDLIQALAAAADKIRGKEEVVEVRAVVSNPVVLTESPRKSSVPKAEQKPVKTNQRTVSSPVTQYDKPAEGERRAPATCYTHRQ